MKFSYKLQELRKGSGMSQEEFAELLGVSRQSVSKWESGKGYPEIDKLIFISNYFNTSLDLLLKDAQQEANSIPVSEKSTKSVRKSKKINLTKSKDVKKQHINNDTFNNVSQYISDPVPNKKKQSLQLQRTNVSPYAQVRPVTNYQFGKKNNKLSKGSIFLTACVGAIAISIIATLGMVSSSDNYATSTEFTDTTMVVVDEYDVYSYDNNLDWKNLYDDEFSSQYELELKDNINNQEQSLLIDKNGNVYYSGYDTVVAYLYAQHDMKNTLDCSELYQKYLSFEYTETHNYFLDVYSVDLDEWVIINEHVIQIYPNQYSYDKEEYLNMLPYTIDFGDILSSSVEDWQDYNNTPFEKVYRVHSESYASVAGEIVDLCIQAIDDRKLNLNMNQYIASYETLNNKCELIKCTNRNNEITFIPKDFLMVNVSDLDEDVSSKNSSISSNISLEQENEVAQMQ